MIGWLITVLAFMSVSKKVTFQRGVMDAMNNIIVGVADKKLQVRRDKENNIHITSME
jgi:hypothetical protein